MIYRRNLKTFSNRNENTMEKPMSFATFKLKIATGLMMEGKTVKRGRPSFSDDGTPKSKRKLIVPLRPIHDNVIRYDNVEHWPDTCDVRRICRFKGCCGRTNVRCSKCEVHLCFNSKINHFLDYHAK